MRQKSLKVVVTFGTTTEALKAEQICAEEHIPGRMIPVPRQISAGCGLAWMSQPEERERILHILTAGGVAIEEWHELML